MAVNFYLDSRTDKSGDAPIRVSISLNGVRYMTSTGYGINPSKWDDKKQRVKSNNAKGITSTVINSHLNTIETDYIRFENKCKSEKLDVTVDLIKDSIYTRSQKTTPKKSDDTMFPIFDLFVKESGQANNWSISTIKKLAVVRNHLHEYSSMLKFDDLTDKELTKYLIFLREKKEMRNTTLIKQLGILKWFLRWATQNGHNTNTAYQSFKPKLKKTEKRIIFLSWDELMTVYNFNIPESKEYLARVRDVFCFCCFTSLRYSDVRNLRRSDIRGEALHITTVKTSDSLIIELNKYSKAILSKYEGLPFENNRALPVISNQKMNDYLKELGELCEINEPQTVTYYVGNKRIDEVYPKYELLGTHCGRRTFICNALALGIPAQVVMKWTGHSDYSAMKPYIAVAETVKFEAMNKFNEI